MKRGFLPVTLSSIRFNRAEDADLITYAYLHSHTPREVRRGTPISSSRMGRRKE